MAIQTLKTKMLESQNYLQPKMKLESNIFSPHFCLQATFEPFSVSLLFFYHYYHHCVTNNVNDNNSISKELYWDM